MKKKIVVATMKKVLSLLFAVTMIAPLFMQVSVHATTKINYNEEKFNYIPSETVVLDGNKYFKLVVKKTYEGLSSNDIIYVDSNYNLVTDGNLINKLVYVSVIKSNIIVGVDRNKITKLADDIVEKSGIIESLGNDFIESVLGNAITGNFKGLCNAFNGNLWGWEQSYSDFIKSASIDSATYICYVASIYDLMNLCTENMTELYNFYNSNSFKNIDKNGLSYTEAQKYEKIVRNCISSLKTTEYYIKYLAENISGNKINNSVDAFDILKNVAKNDIDDIFQTGASLGIGDALADSLAYYKDYKDFFAGVKKALNISGRLQTYYNSYEVIDTASKTYINVNDVIKNTQTLTGTTISVPTDNNVGSMTSSSSKNVYTTNEKVIITWTQATNATRYGLTIVNNATNEKVIDSSNFTGTSYVVGVLPAGTYRFNMCGYSSNGKAGPISAVREFTVNEANSSYSTGTYKPSKSEGLNIRSGAATSYSKVGTIAFGTSFVVTQINGIWGKTTCNGVTGWVCLDYATYVSSSASTTPASESYTIDVNGYVDGIYKTGLDGYVTFDVYINGSCVKNDVGDFCTSYVDGTSYEIKDIKPKKGYKYVSGRYLSGKINGGTVWVYLTLESDGTDAAEATGFVEYVNSKVGENFKDGYCQAFVCRAVYNYFGKDANACCATNAWEKWKQSNSRNDIPLGAAVYFGNAREIDSYCGKDAGHSAIYVGNNTIVHAWSGKIVSTTIDYVISRGYTYRGWGWQANYKISQPKESVPDSSHEAEAGWSEWSETKPASKDYRTIESKTQYGYYHYVHKWTDTGFTGTYPVKDYKVFTDDPTDILNYHEYWSDSKLSDNGSPWIGDGKSYKCYPNKCCSLGSNVSTTGRYLYDLEKTRTVYRYKDEEPEKYTVTYNANGGTGAPNGQTKIAGEDLTLSSIEPTRADYKFLGWSTFENGDVKFKPGEKYTEDKNITLYAVWEEIKIYTIRYDACGGENAPSAQTKVHGEELIISTEVPTRLSYDFEGWATEKGGAVVYKSGDVYSENKDATLYAVWKLSESAPLITVEKCVGNIGDTVDVNILISRNIGIAGFTFNIAFDNTKLEIVSVEKSDLLKGTITTTIDEDNEASTLNNIKVVYATPTDFTGNGALFTLKFKVKEDAEIGKTPIALTYRENDVVNKNLEEVGLHVENGEIDIENILFGDAHRDGNIDTKDAVRIMQYLAGWQVDIWFKAADVNKDGKISTMDSVLLSQYLAGWDIKLGEKN